MSAESAYTFALENIHDAAGWFWGLIGEKAVVALHGPMGAGKTSFVHALCDLKGIRDPVGSPTFSLVNEYMLPEGGRVYHIDLYRIRDEEEARQAGIEDILYSGAACFVEWPEKAPGIFPPEAVEATISVNPDRSRTIKLPHVP
jgi:tRNA threonylcarbamoyladenosine biosynthesis protein TsaE